MSEAQIEDQSLRSVADLLMFVPGATPGTGEANRDQLTLRGNNTTADFFVDGLRDDAQYFRDFYNLDRVEVLKGPNAMIFGRGGGGGIINRVTKRAGLINDREVILSHDSEGGTRLTADDNMRLTGALGLRMNGVWEHGDSFRNFTKIKRYGINPTLGWQPGADTRVDLSYEYFHDRRTTDRGLPSRGWASARRLRQCNSSAIPPTASAMPTSRSRRWASNRSSATISCCATARRSPTMTNSTSNVFPSGAVSAAGTVTIGAYNSRNDRRNLISQTDLVWDGSLAGIDQTWLFGFEVGRQTSRNQRLSGRFLDDNGSVTLADPTVARRIEFFRSASDADNRTRATVAAGLRPDSAQADRLARTRRRPPLRPLPPARSTTSGRTSPPSPAPTISSAHASGWC